MGVSRKAKHSLSVVAAAAMLASCNASGAFAPAELEPSIAEVSVAAKLPAFHRHATEKSWILPAAKDLYRLLFESDPLNDEVQIFELPDLELIGTITGLDFPQGECSDNQGNIWIANTDASQMLKYSRTGKLLKTLDMPYEYPVGCAWSPKNGDLAVTDIGGTGSAPGNVEIFHDGSGKPNTYSARGIARYYFAGYDPNGNLFFDGLSSSGSNETAMLAELPAGSGSTRLITLTGGTFSFPGSVQWYAPENYLAVGDQHKSDILWVSLSGSSGTITGATPLDGYNGEPVCDVVEGVIGANDKRFFAGGDSCFYPAVYRWAYAAGGLPTNYNNTSGTNPVGAAISVK